MYGRYEKSRKEAEKRAFLDACVLRLSDPDSSPPGVDLRVPFGPRCFRYVALDLPGGKAGVGTSALFERLGIDPEEAFAAAAKNSAAKAVEFTPLRTTYLSPPAGGLADRAYVRALVEFAALSPDGTEPSFAFATSEGLLRAYEAVGGPFCFVLPRRAPAYLVSGDLDAAALKCAAAALGALGKPVLGGHAFAFDGEKLAALAPR